jgi:hypothetical protein
MTFSWKAFWSLTHRHAAGSSRYECSCQIHRRLAISGMAVPFHCLGASLPGSGADNSSWPGRRRPSWSSDHCLHAASSPRAAARSWVVLAAPDTAVAAGRMMAAKIPRMTMTTSNSMSVKPAPWHCLPRAGRRADVEVVSKWGEIRMRGLIGYSDLNRKKKVARQSQQV